MMNQRKIVDHFGTGLLPCPMCGAVEAKDSAEAWSGGVFIREDEVPAAWGGAFPAHIKFTVQCGLCDLQITRGTLEGARLAWNRRTRPGEEPEDKTELPTIIRTGDEVPNLPEEVKRIIKQRDAKGTQEP